jgi:lipopolysaccharide export system permease protein
LTISKYLLFLTPLISVQIMPASVLLSVLATYALAARRSEVMAWWSSGQSVYRLILPGILFATGVGIGAWVVQEQIMPEANRRQDELRAQIRGGVLKATTSVGRQWLAAPEAAGRLYAYQFNEEQNSLEDPVIYDFDAEGVHLKQITAGRSGVWVEPHTLEIQDAEILQLASPHAVTATQRFVRLKDVESIDAFKPVINNPAHLSAKKLSEYIKEARGRTGSITVLTMALQAKYAEPFGCLVLALIGIPLALSFGHRNTLIALCLAIGIGLAFWSIEGGFRQLGAYGLLPVTIAAWSPLLLFASAGGYLLSKART